MNISDFTKICQLVDAEGMTASVCEKLNTAGAESSTGGPVTEGADSFVLIGYLVYQHDGRWRIKNV
jgi:hypothetical protein